MEESFSRTMTLEDVIRQHEEISNELRMLREQVLTAGQDASRAHDRITHLEFKMDEINRTISQMQADVTEMRVDMQHVKSEVKEFAPRQERFLSQTWRLIFRLVMLIGGMFVILGGLVGIKLWFPFLQ